MITAIIGSITISFIAILYITLVLGLPYGEFAMGGKYTVMPKSMRVMCAISVFVQIFAMIILLQTGNVLATKIPDNVSKIGCYVFAGYLVLNTIMNAISKSKKEKYIMTPLAAITAICFFVTAMGV